MRQKITQSLLLAASIFGFSMGTSIAESPSAQAIDSAEQQEIARLARLIDQQEARSRLDYYSKLTKKIEDQWSPPSDLHISEFCTIRVTQNRSGVVTNVTTHVCSDFEIFRGLREAVLSASPLPLPETMRHFIRTFDYELSAQEKE